MSGKRWAVCVFNKNDEEKTYDFDLKHQLNRWEPLDVFDVWKKEIQEQNQRISAVLPAHDCDVFILQPKKAF